MVLAKLTILNCQYTQADHRVNIISGK